MHSASGKTMILGSRHDHTVGKVGAAALAEASCILGSSSSVDDMCSQAHNEERTVQIDSPTVVVNLSMDRVGSKPD